MYDMNQGYIAKSDPFIVMVSTPGAMLGVMEVAVIVRAIVNVNMSVKTILCFMDIK